LYPKNLDQWEQAKIMVPYMITDLAAYYDSGGTYFVNVTTGGFGITTHRSGRNLEWLTVLLNSQLLDWFLKKVSTTFHGGYFAANKQFLVQLPIADCGAENQESAIRLSRWLHHLKSRLVPTAQTTRDPLMLAYWERVLNGLVYELYFPEEVHGAGLRLFDLVEAAHLPSVEQTILSVHAEPGVEQAILSVGAERKRQEDTDKIVCATLRQKLDPTVEQTILSVHAEGKSQEHTDKIVCAALRRKFEELHDGAHPLRIALDKLQTLDTVRIIEGKA
jgi:hypothetical protein